jgi:hypothetical protein
MKASCFTADQDLQIRASGFTSGAESQIRASGFTAGANTAILASGFTSNVADQCSALLTLPLAAHEREQPSQRESKKRNREGGTGKRVLQEVENADEKDEDEATGRLERMSSAGDKCANQC